MLSILLKSLRRKNDVFKATSWAGQQTEEAKFAQRVAISSAIYLTLTERIGQEHAFELMRQMLVPIGVQEQLANIRDLKGSDDWERLQAFYNFMGLGGVGQFVERTLVENNEHKLHYEVRNCFFYRFYSQADTPELTQFFCEVDDAFFAAAFPGYRFHRGSSMLNTVAHGQEHCDFIFEKVPPPA
jgi:hypothetical protein